MTLSKMRARVLRLRDLARSMGKEVANWKAQEGPLLPVERKKYLEAVYDVTPALNSGVGSRVLASPSPG